MSSIRTYSGIMIDPVSPEEEQICLGDIAHALSLLCRANGHFRHFYSVGQHCLNCMREAEARGCSNRVQLACLLHDASEAYLSDVTRPVKQELPRYLEIEQPLQDLIFRKYLGSDLTQEEHAQVFAIDDSMLQHEFLALMGFDLGMPVQPLQSEPAMDWMEFSLCETTYLQQAQQLLACGSIR